MMRNPTVVVGCLTLAVAGCGSPLPTAPPDFPAPLAAADVGGAVVALDATNQAPRLVLKTSPVARPGDPLPVISGVEPLTVAFNLCESSDPDQVIGADGAQDPSGDTLNWQFHFGDGPGEALLPDGSFNPDFEHFCRTSHTYSAGRYVATVSVTDKHLEDQSGDVRSLARATTRVAIEVGRAGGAAAPASTSSVSQTKNGLYWPNVLSFSLTGPAPTGGGTITITSTGDLNSASEFVTVSASGFTRNYFESSGEQCGTSVTSATLTQAEVAALLGGFTVTPSSAVDDLGCPSDSEITITLEYAH